MAINVRLTGKPQGLVSQVVVLEFWIKAKPYVRYETHDVRSWTFDEVASKLKNRSTRLLSFHFVTKERKELGLYPIATSPRYFVYGVTRMIGDTRLVNRPSPRIGTAELVSVHRNPDGRVNIVPAEGVNWEDFTT